MTLEYITQYKQLNTQLIQIENEIKESANLWFQAYRLPKSTGARAEFIKTNRSKMYRCSLEGTNKKYDIQSQIDDLELAASPIYLHQFNETDYKEFLQDFKDFFD